MEVSRELVRTVVFILGPMVLASYVIGLRRMEDPMSLWGYTRILEAIERGLHVRSCRRILDCMVAASIFLGIFRRGRNRLAMEWRS